MTCYVAQGKSKTMTAKCESCKGLIEIGLPMPVRKLDTILKIFEESHQDCERKKQNDFLNKLIQPQIELIIDNAAEEGITLSEIEAIQIILDYIHDNYIGIAEEV